MQSTYWLEKVLKMISLYVSALLCTLQHIVIRAMQLSGVNYLPPNDHYMGRTAQLTFRCCILYIYSTNIRTEYFKHSA